MGNIHLVRPNEALIINGGCRYPRKKILIGGGCLWTWYVGNKVQVMSLALMTLTPHCSNAETFEGVPVSVSGVAQCKISRKMRLLKLAAEQFLDRTTKQIANSIQLTLEGHLRSILSTMTVEEAYKDRLKFAFAVWEVAAADVAKMGIEIISFTITDIYDSVLYLSSLGKTQTANVLRDARIGVAEADRDASIKESDYQKIIMEARYGAYTKIADNMRKYQLEKIKYDIELNTAKAEAQLAFELQVYKTYQNVKYEEKQIDIINKKKEIEIESQEIIRKEWELMSTIKLTSEADIYKRKMLSQGNNYYAIEIAKGESLKEKSIGVAEADMLLVIGLAKAEQQRLKAMVFQDYGEAAMTSMILEAMPKIAAEICAPLKRTDEIVFLGNRDHLTRVVNRLVAQVPPSLNALTGLNLSTLVNSSSLINYLHL